MTRVQVYLDTKHIDILNFLAAQANTSRSQALRTTLELADKKIPKAPLNSKNKIHPKYAPLLKMAGFIKNGRSDLARNIDEIYLRD